jgi:hypothetical protein
MYEKYPLREIKQPPEVIFEARLVSGPGDSIPITNQMVQIFRFEDDPSADFIEIIQKTGKRRIFIGDPEVLDVLEEIGCDTNNYMEWDESHMDPVVDSVTAGGRWDVLDFQGDYSLIEEIKENGLLTTQPRVSEDFFDWATGDFDYDSARLLDFQIAWLDPLPDSVEDSTPFED